MRATSWGKDAKTCVSSSRTIRNSQRKSRTRCKAAFGLIKPTDQFAEDDGAEDAAGAPDDGKTSKTSKAAKA